ncbi:hypothetical protein Hanom_Chr01g00032851 [Helianthus anomalus]
MLLMNIRDCVFRMKHALTMGDMLHSYVQWPRQHVKLLNGGAPSK